MERWGRGDTKEFVHQAKEEKKRDEDEKKYEEGFMRLLNKADGGEAEDENETATEREEHKVTVMK